MCKHTTSSGGFLAPESESKRKVEDPNESLLQWMLQRKYGSLKCTTWLS